MKRIVMFAAAIVIMLVIIAISIYSINHIGEINRKRDEKEAASNMAARIVATTETVSVWDRLREERQTVAVTDVSAPPEGQSLPEGETVPEGVNTSEVQPASEGMQPDAAPADQEPAAADPVLPPETQTATTAAQGILARMD